MISPRRPPWLWGVTQHDLAAVTPGRDLLANPVAEAVRAVEVAARPTTVYRWLCGELVVTYQVRPSRGRSRLVSHLVWEQPPGPLPRLRTAGLAWGDLLMMRKQLRTLRGLAEQTEELEAPSDQPAGAEGSARPTRAGSAPGSAGRRLGS